MKKYRCGKCGEEFVGRLEICPKCGVELHYLDEEVKKESTSNKQVPKFHFEDEDVNKKGIQDEEVVNSKENSVVPTKQQPTDYRMTREFNGESYFDGNVFQLLGTFLLALLLFVVTLTFGFPWCVCMIYRWEAKHTVINGYRLYFDGKGGQLFGRFLLWLLLTIVTAGIFLFFAANALKKWKSKHIVFADYAKAMKAENKK